MTSEFKTNFDIKLAEINKSLAELKESIRQMQDAHSVTIGDYEREGSDVRSITIGDYTNKWSA